MAMHWRQPNVVPDYRRSFHGLSAALGDQRVATCVSCHGGHEIRPSRDPLSSVSAAKVSQTCAACHTGTAPGFGAGGVHHNPALSGHKLVDIAGFMYLMTTVVVIGSMLLHNGLDFWGRLRERRGLGGGQPSTPGATHLRFTLTDGCSTGRSPQVSGRWRGRGSLSSTRGGFRLLKPSKAPYSGAISIARPPSCSSRLRCFTSATCSSPVAAVTTCARACRPSAPPAIFSSTASRVSGWVRRAGRTGGTSCRPSNTTSAWCRRAPQWDASHTPRRWSISPCSGVRAS